jgi:ribosome-interacting GTPase 1
MQIGIIGLPYAGKTTLFATLASRKAETDAYRKKKPKKESSRFRTPASIA